MTQGQTENGRPSGREYLAVVSVIGMSVVLIVRAWNLPNAPADPQEVVAPMIAMFSLTAAIWLLMVIYRNVAVLLGTVTIRYFLDDCGADAPSEGIERPTRTFNNLMQVPALFYVIALLMIVLRKIDASQVSLAWIYVATRAVHAAIYILFNYVPLRFAFYAASCITLAIMWARLALDL
jgi:hypothetical protein